MTTTAEIGAAPETCIDVLERELGRLARVLEAMQRKRNYPLDRSQYVLLRLLETQGPMPTVALADLLLLDDSTVTRQIAAMEAADLVARRANPNDGRSSLIHPTRHGLAVAKKMRHMRLERIAHLVEDWTSGEREKLAKLLQKLNVSLTDSLLEA
jgi:DNA-binding MarR family transcriptional regulator